MNFFIANILYFQQLFGINLELLYFISMVLIIEDILINRGTLLIKTMKYILPIIFYATIQILLFDYIEIIEVIIFILKMILCIHLFVYVKYNKFKNIKIESIVWYLSILYALSIPVSFLLRGSEVLWLQHDMVNIHSSVRLKLFYFEPSELAFYVSITIICFISLWKKFNKETYKKIIVLLLLFINIILTKGMGGIAIVSATLFLMYNMYTFRHSTRLNIAIHIVAMVGIFLGVAIFMNGNNELSLRIKDIINGDDASFNYRFGIGIDILKAAMINSKGIGVGFGNLNSPIVKSFYSQFGLVEYISNSFMYFISEGGTFAILYIGLFIFNLLRNCLLQKSIFKFSILFFLVLYQVAGGYFTSPLIWIMYGIVANKEHLTS